MSKNHEGKPMDSESVLAMERNEPGFWREIWQQLRLVVALVRDPEVPFYLKLLPFTAVVYVLFPFDLLTDLVPVIGQLDDVGALLVSSKVFIELAPQHVVARHMQAIREKDGFSFEAGGPAADDADISDAIIIDGEHSIVLDDESQD